MVVSQARTGRARRWHTVLWVVFSIVLALAAAEAFLQGLRRENVALVAASVPLIASVMMTVNRLLPRGDDVRRRR